MSKLDVNYIVNLYNNNVSIRQIAKLNNCARPTIKKCLQKQNINLREYSNRCWKYSDEVILLYKQGLIVKEIVNKLNISTTTVLKILKRAKIKTPSVYRSNGKTSSGWKGFGCVSSTFLTSLKTSAIARSIYFDLELEDIYNLYIKQNKKCKLSNVDIHFGSTKIKTDNRNASVDRIDSKLFYTVDNVQLVDVKVNYMKHNFSTEKFIWMSSLIADKNNNCTNCCECEYEFCKNTDVDFIFSIAKRSAKYKKIDFDLDKKFLLDLFYNQNKRCNLTNLPIEFKSKFMKPFFNQASIDRIDSNKGYTKLNTQLVIKDVNFMKNKFDQCEFIEICKQVTEYQKVKNARTI